VPARDRIPNPVARILTLCAQPEPNSRILTFNCQANRATAINGIVIVSKLRFRIIPNKTNPPGSLENYHRENVIGGANAFVMAAQNVASSSPCGSSFRFAVHRTVNSAREIADLHCGKLGAFRPHAEAVVVLLSSRDHGFVQRHLLSHISACQSRNRSR
jgi:hypothetical protein